MSSLVIPTERDGVFMQEVGRGSSLFLERAENPGLGSQNPAMDTIVWDHQTFVGRMSLHFLSRSQEAAMVSYEITPQLRRQHYGTVALENISLYALDELNLERLIAIIKPGNTASEGLASKAQYEMVSSHGGLLVYHRNAPVQAQPKNT